MGKSSKRVNDNCSVAQLAAGTGMKAQRSVHADEALLHRSIALIDRPGMLGNP